MGAAVLSVAQQLDDSIHGRMRITKQIKIVQMIDHADGDAQRIYHTSVLSAEQQIALPVPSG